jgi:replication initiation and membrane attachment protein DnaB
MNVIDFYIENFINFEESDWYKKDNVKNIFTLHYSFEQKNKFSFSNEYNALEFLKEILEPDIEKHEEIDNNIFLAICFYLEIKGFEISKLKEYLKCPLNNKNINKSLEKLVFFIRDNEVESSNYVSRRKFNNSLTIKKIS